MFWRFGINCPSAFWKILKLHSFSRAISKFSKITRVIYPKNPPNETYGYWLITPNQQTVCFENYKILQNSGQLQDNSVYGAMLITITMWFNTKNVTKIIIYHFQVINNEFQDTFLTYICYWKYEIQCKNKLA